MQITHHAGKLSVGHHIEAAGQSVLLTNKAGSYAWMSCSEQGLPLSKYQGVFFYPKEGRMMKVIESFIPQGAGAIKKVDNYFSYIEQHREHVTERYTMPLHFSALCYTLSKPMPVELCLDVRDAYDSRAFGKYYTHYMEGNLLIVEFVKKKDVREDGGEHHGEEEFKMFIAIAARGLSPQTLHSILHATENWTQHRYAYDESRGDTPTSYAYALGTITSDAIVIAFSGNKDKAKREAAYLFKNITHLYRKVDLNLPRELNLSSHHNEDKMAYASAARSMHNLSVLDHGLFAGLPWFFQYWSRDTLISAKALSLTGKAPLAKKLLFEYLSHIDNEGRIPSRLPVTPLRAADSTGWMFFRLEHMWKSRHLKHAEKERLRHALHHAILAFHKYQVRDGLVYNNAKETWMDTDESGDGRAGYRIELQALYLAMHRIMYELDPLQSHAMSEKHLKHLVRQNFWDSEKGILHDGAGDSTIRPNVFLAAYIYPELLTRQEWVMCMDNTLKALWLDWGGIATIEKNDKRFRKEHTGVRNTSYHSGDSWYFLNNLAAIVLHRLDAHRYHHYIQQILKASSQEMLWQGTIANSAEISGAVRRESLGCQSQLWSSAMYVELVHELYGKR